MAAKIEQFRKLQVVGEPLVLYNIWDPGNRSRAERTTLSFLRGEGARTLRLPSQAHHRFGRKLFHTEALRTRNSGWLTRHSSEENYEK
jgi:hypothetical protein